MDRPLHARSRMACRERYAHQAALRKKPCVPKCGKMPWVPPNKTRDNAVPQPRGRLLRLKMGPDPYGASPVRGTSRLSAPVLVDCPAT
jgi:hypothetical protein